MLIYRCTAKNSNGKRCRLCIHVPMHSDVPPSAYRHTGGAYFLFCTLHRRKISIDGVAASLGSTSRKPVESPLKLNRETCYISYGDGKNNDAQFDATVCSNRLQQQCLKKNKLATPTTDQVTLAERQHIQGLVTKAIAGSETYQRLSLKSLGVTNTAMRSYFSHSVFLLKGSAALRVMLMDAFEQDVTGILDSLREPFDAFVKSSDVDSTIVMPPSTTNEDRAVMYELLSHALMMFLTALTPRDIGDINEMMTMALSDLDIGDSNLEVTHEPRAAIHIDEKYEIHQFHFRHVFANHGSRWTISKTKKTGEYQMKQPNDKVPVDIGKSSIFFYFNGPTSPITKVTASTITFENLLPLHNAPDNVIINGNIPVNCHVSEAISHTEDITLTFGEGVDVVVGDVISLYNGTTIGHITRKLTRRTVMVNHQVWPRSIGGVRRLFDYSAWDMPLSLSLQREIDIPTIGANFGLLRLMFPLCITKKSTGRRGWSKAELLDVSVANTADKDRTATWEKFGLNRDTWTTPLCVAGGTVCVTAVSLRYQDNDLSVMVEKSEGTNRKGDKRRARLEMMTSLKTMLGVGGKFKRQRRKNLREKLQIKPGKTRISLPALVMLDVIMSAKYEKWHKGVQKVRNTPTWTLILEIASHAGEDTTQISQLPTHIHAAIYSVVGNDVTIPPTIELFA